jgi:hypothetical protein
MRTEQAFRTWGRLLGHFISKPTLHKNNKHTSRNNHNNNNNNRNNKKHPAYSTMHLYYGTTRILLLLFLFVATTQTLVVWISLHHFELALDQSIGSEDQRRYHVQSRKLILPEPQYQQQHQQQQQQEEEESFSACILIMDENHRLPEWLSYHYHTLNLRYLVVAVDPHSQTLASSIFDRWRDRMTIIEWTDSDFTNLNLLWNQTTPVGLKTKMHRTRQDVFVQACTMHLHEHNRTWTAYTDVDEYMAINSYIYKDAEELMQQPGSILKLVQEFSTTENYPKGLKNRDPKSWFRRFHKPCVAIPRILFSATESSPREIAGRVPLPIFVDPQRFDTLRWRYPTTPTSAPAWGKSLLDVSKIHAEDLKEGSDAHFALKSICTKENLEYNWSPIGLRHYLGSWEAYSFKNDARKGTLRNYDNWKAQAFDQGGGADDSVRPWISGFIDSVGEDAAKFLLQDAGLPPGYRKPDQDPANWAAVDSLENKWKMAAVMRAKDEHGAVGVIEG